MKFGRIALVSLAIAFVMVAVSASAAAGTATINPGASHVEHVNVDAGEWLTYTWFTVSGGSLHFVLTGPGSVVVEDVTASSGGDTLIAEAGSYTFTWTNQGSSAITLSYSMPFADFGNAVNWFLWVALAMVIIIVAVVVIVVVLATRKKKVPQQAQPGMLPNAAQAIASGRCPKCGRSIDPTSAFCAVCGAQLR